MGWFASKLTKALRQALKDPGRAAAAIRGAAKEPVRTAAEAELVVQVLTLFPLPPQVGDDGGVGTPLHDVVAWLQGVEDEKATEVFKRSGAPELLRVFDAIEPTLAASERAYLAGNDLMFLLKVVCMYAPAGGLERIHRAARSPQLRDQFLWSIIFAVIGEDGHPWATAVVDALRDPLPEAFAGVAYLDLTNRLALAKRLERHPFDSEAGVARLQGWLASRAKDEYSYAHSAAASIPFLAADRRAAVQELADRHPSKDVQLEAAWAAATCGDARGLEILRVAAEDPRQAAKALRYLEELGAKAPTPIQSASPDFRAMAQMCEWLAHPQEMGRPPDEIEQADARELYWPPTNDRRRLWLFRYRYEPEEGEDDDDDERDEDDEEDISDLGRAGYGMVGSVTFALFGETTADKTVEEVYALHCAWELETNEDPRAPKERTIAAGMRLLARHNPGFGTR